jgi:hypothetical protein
MLQGVHQKKTAPRACSLYSKWIRENRQTGVALVAVWIDRDMRCFERELAKDLDSRPALQDALDGTGGATSLPLPKCNPVPSPTYHS